MIYQHVLYEQFEKISKGCLVHLGASYLIYVLHFGWWVIHID